MNVTTELTVDITKACCVLHNFVRDKNGYNFQDTLLIEGLEEINTTPTDRGQRSAIDMRNTFADYFSTTGAVPWQNYFKNMLNVFFIVLIYNLYNILQFFQINNLPISL